MDKILKKLKDAQIKAQEMRSNISASAKEKKQKTPKPENKLKLFERHARMTSIAACFPRCNS